VPETTVLWQTVQVHWKTFLADLECTTDPPVLPAFVTAEVEAFLRCGRLEHGLVLVRCGDCGWCKPVAFSCQRRGFCTSCIGRRMCDFATRAVDRVFPRVPIRQWVLTCPRDLRPRLAADPDLTTLVLRTFVAAVSSWLRRQGRRLGLRGALKTGGATVIQRFNSAQPRDRPRRPARPRMAASRCVGPVVIRGPRCSGGCFESTRSYAGGVRGG
jgi:hypothetical protein